MDAEVSLDSLLARLTLLEERIAANPYYSSDPNVIVHKPEMSFTPPPEVLAAFPEMKADFFRSRLDDEERHELLFSCPTNTVCRYEPPVLNEHPAVSDAVREADEPLREIQYRLCLITRPLDWFMYQSTRNNWDADQWRTHSQALARDMRVLGRSGFVHH